MKHIKKFGRKIDGDDLAPKKDAHRLIDKFTADYKGDSISDFAEEFKKFCNREDIIEADLMKWKEQFLMFLHENPGFAADGGVGWARQYLIDNIK